MNYPVFVALSILWAVIGIVIAHLVPITLTRRRKTRLAVVGLLLLLMVSTQLPYLRAWSDSARSELGLPVFVTALSYVVCLAFGISMATHRDEEPPHE